ncbi:hypothetical protein KIN20_019867 [Parelaphostrongylus tenuis]|uniref:Uncharacterized protein n=1 Tax=Parelaphostrongylus tenuis TaxID=148309 RepID=A0AAD5MLQ4_PARTN|nr:hypothetical protein KIN20_019867 [Parelaphostrongylus tenuis]
MGCVVLKQAAVSSKPFIRLSMCNEECEFALTIQTVTVSTVLVKCTTTSIERKEKLRIKLQARCSIGHLENETRPLEKWRMPTDCGYVLILIFFSVDSSLEYKCT